MLAQFTKKMMLSFTGAAIGIYAMMGAAMAQNSLNAMTDPSEQRFNSYDVEQLAALLQDMQLETAIFRNSANNPTIAAKVGPNATFLVIPSICEDFANGKNCRGFITTVNFDVDPTKDNNAMANTVNQQLIFSKVVYVNGSMNVYRAVNVNADVKGIYLQTSVYMFLKDVAKLAEMGNPSEVQSAPKSVLASLGLQEDRYAEIKPATLTYTSADLNPRLLSMEIDTSEYDTQALMQRQLTGSLAEKEERGFRDIESILSAFEVY